MTAINRRAKMLQLQRILSELEQIERDLITAKIEEKSTGSASMHITNAVSCVALACVAIERRLRLEKDVRIGINDPVILLDNNRNTTSNPNSVSTENNSGE